MNALFAPRAKRTRFVVAFGLALLLAAPAAMIWANKVQIMDEIGYQNQMEQALSENMARQQSNLGLPAGFMPSAEFSPFGGALKPRRLSAEKAADTLASPFGDVAWDPAEDDIIATLKPGLRWGANEVTRTEKGVLRPGLNYVRLSPAARQNPDEAMRSLAEAATIIAPLPRSTFLVNVEARNMHLLRQSAYIDRIRAMEAAFKIDPVFGARPMIRKADATDPELRAWVTLVPGVSTSDAARGIAAIQGVSNVKESPFGGQLFLQVHFDAVDRLARNDNVLAIATDYDYMLQNSENVPSTQGGSAEDTSFIRPFDVVGVDGGGLNAAGLPSGIRVNNGSAQVPPQIVAVVDNGISVDTPNFSQTATQTTTVLAPIGPSHRKVHAIQNAGDTGLTCDAALSGGGTHGSTVAATIAAYPSQFGVFATRAGIGDGGEPRNMNLDGIARGARIIMEDAATTAVCTINSLIERGGNVSPGSLLDRMNLAICPNSSVGGPCDGIVGGGADAHLAVLPFGAPANFSTFQFLLSNGTYPQQAVDLDVFLYNNRDFMIFSPVGNNGGIVTTARFHDGVFPDLFNGTAVDEDPNFPQAVQISPPATAKNVVAVGSSVTDCFTVFATSDCEDQPNVFSSKGPATPESLRMAPIVMAPGSDLIGGIYTTGVAVFRSNDNDNLAPIDAQLDEGNYGGSYAAGYMTGAGAIIRDYFAQGFYPTGDRVTADRTAKLSGAFVKAALAASADFGEGLRDIGQDENEKNLRRTRFLDLGSVSGVGGLQDVGIMGNSEQGYGRAVLTQVLPLSNWSDTFVVHPASGAPREYPAAGMLAFDRLATGEPLINNTTTSVTHTFRIASPNVITLGSGAVAVTTGQLRIALAWPDPPSTAGSGGTLINDLDLVLESPGPDNCLTAADAMPNGGACPAAAADDNEFVDGNNYAGGTASASVDQWSKIRTLTTGAEKHDFRNPIEAIHLNGDPNNNRNFDDSHLYVGRWRVTVKVGAGGAIPGQITINPVPGDVDGVEDDNNNDRLDAGEDNNANGLLDQPGQPYALVVAGPVFLAEANPPAGPTSYPASSLSWTSSRYSCASNAVLNVIDTTGTATANDIKVNTTYQVLNAAGTVVDTESNFNFSAGTAPYQFVSAQVPVRLAGPGIPGNGILEADSDYQIIATYARPGQSAVKARSLVRCTPDLINAAFGTAGGNAVGEQWALNGGCDDDDNFDAGEVVTYGVALQNRSTTDTYADVTATLTPSGPGAAALRVLDSPKNAGTMPGSATNSVFFHVYVDPAVANSLPVANRVVTMTLNLDTVTKGLRLSRQSYSFSHAINSDRQTLSYSTDYPTGSREVRDINRNLVIDPGGTVDPLQGFIMPAEDVTFSTLFGGSGTLVGGPYTNQYGEDLDLSGPRCQGGVNAGNPCAVTADCPGSSCSQFTGSERDILPNDLVDRGILASSNPAGPHPVPWNFDVNSGGWIPFRHPGSTPAGISQSNPVWEYKTNGTCGFQTSAGAIFGIWHTGDGDATTPDGAATACDNAVQPGDPATPPKVELIFDVLQSPIIAKVNQANDARGFPYVVEFQRVGYNVNLQTFDGYAGGGLLVDNNVDSENAISLLGQELNAYTARRSGGWAETMFRDAGQYFPGGGINPTSTAPVQRTFGPFLDGGAVGDIDAGDTGFSGYTQNSNPKSLNPIPVTEPDYLPYPLPGAVAIGVCDGGTNDNQTCDPANVSDPCITGGGVCTPTVNTVAGPVRNFDATLIGMEGGFVSMILNPSGPETFYFHLAGPAGNRWQIGLGFWAMEGASGATDYGKAVDDVVFEWSEYHPEDEAALGNAPACSRFNGLGQPQGGQCATLTADRTSLTDCDEGIEITLFDAKCLSIGAGNSVPLGGACTTTSQCGTGGVCTAALSSVTVQITTESDSIPVDYEGQQVFYPNEKTFTLNAVAGSPGLFRGTVIFSTTTDDANHIFNVPGTDSTFVVYYYDPLCDGDRDGQNNEDDFANVDGDGIPDLSDNCAQRYNPGQEDFDADGFGDICDNCPKVFNDSQTDTNGDGAGDDCEYDDIDTDGIPNADDLCDEVYNAGQACTNVAGVCGAVGTCNIGTGTCSAPSFAVGAACVANADCNRPNNCATPVYSAGKACTANSGCTFFMDRDADGQPDSLDNCVLTKNGPGISDPNPGTEGDLCVENHPALPRRCNSGHGFVCALDADCVAAGGPNVQTDSDGDKIGNVCDGDCSDATPRNVCRNNADLSCPLGPATGYPPCGIIPTPGFSAVCQPTITNTGSCSNVDDDLDADFVEDLNDLCAGISNPPIIAGTQRQKDSDRDGLGDVCDPDGSFDDAGDGVPDDAVSFNGTVSCRTQPLANFTILSAQYRDHDGDLDTFADTGETGRVQISLRNAGGALTDATVILTSSDPDVGCITQPSIVVGDFPAGNTLLLGNFVPGTPGFEFVASNAMNYQGPPSPAPQLTFCVTVVANETLGTAAPICFNVLGDLNPPLDDTQLFTNGPDGLANTDDDGLMVETFDVDKNGDGVFTVDDTFLERTTPGTYRGYCNTAPATECQVDADCPLAGTTPGICYRGSYIRATNVGTPPVGTFAGISCGGYDDPDTNDLCILDPDFPMDWHFHCPAGATNCPHTDSGTCVGGCSYDTPANGKKAHSGDNSLHLGAHWNLTDDTLGDGQHFRALAGFQTGPMNLALYPRAGDLELSFWHIARLMSNAPGGVGGGRNKGQCTDCGDVQIQYDLDPDNGVDNWGFWDKLVPFQNVYDHKAMAWSAFSSYYCLFTPTDTGNAPPNPRTFHETLCFPLGAWSRCGSPYATVNTGIAQCTGPTGDLDATGKGVWMETKFNLASYLGQRVRIRWVAETWNFGADSESYFEIGGSWGTNQGDEGWWLDDIRVSGLVVNPVTPQADTTPRTGFCPLPENQCNEGVGDRGTNVVLKTTDLQGVLLDGVINVPFAGQSIRVSAIDSTLPGGCVGGVAEYEFSRNGLLVQTFGAKSYFLDAPEANTSYSVRARCSTDYGCTSLNAVTIDVGVYSGDGGDTFFGERNSPASNANGVQYFRGVCTAPVASVGNPCNFPTDCAVAGGACNITSSTADDVTQLRWWGPGNYGTDVLRGTVPAGPAPRGTLAAPFWDLAGLGANCFLSNVAGTPTSPGTNYRSGSLNQATDPNPVLGAVTYYDTTSNSPGGSNVNALGCANPSICNNPGWCELGSNAGAPCTTSANCAGGGSCLLRTSFCSTDAGVGSLGGCGRHQACTGGTNAGRLCVAAADCPGGGSCPILPATTSTAGQVCYNLTNVALPPPFGSCPTVGHAKRLVRRVGTGLVCP